MTGKKGWSRQEEATGPVDNAGKRLMRFAMEQDIHDERLWMPIARSANYRRAAAAVDIGLAVARRAEALRLHRGIGRPTKLTSVAFPMMFNDAS
jgi:hypothetical protein